MTRLTRAELVDLVRRLVESLGDGGLSRTLCIEAERALKAEEGAAVELEWTEEYLPHAKSTRLVARTDDFVFHIKQGDGCFLYEGNDNPCGHYHTVDQAKTAAAALDAARRLA